MNYNFSQYYTQYYNSQMSYEFLKRFAPVGKKTIKDADSV